MNKTEKFWNKIAKRYSKQPIADEAAYQTKLKKTQEYLRPDMEILEFGCGTGSTALVHAPYVKHIRAIDLSENMITIAREKAAAAGIANVSFEHADIDQIDVADETYGAVLGLSILHLVEDKETVIVHVHRMLKPGGVFVTNTACLGDNMKFIKYIAPFGRLLGFMPLVKVFTDANLQQSLEQGGFSIEHHWQSDKKAAVFIVARKV